MVDSKIVDRLEFLAKKFNVFETGLDIVKNKIEYLTETGHQAIVIEKDNILLAILAVKSVEKDERPLKTVSVSINVFSDIIAADPTPNKSCVQWMLNVFTRYIRLGDTKSVEAAKRFILEDLPMAYDYLTLFEANKRKQKFKRLCEKSYVLKNAKITDPTDINQYKSLSQLFDAVDPFIHKDPSEMEKMLMLYVNRGEAEIPVKDRKFTLYVPKSRDASTIFSKFAGWCTARIDNSNFKEYTDRVRPDGSKSKLYIIINNKFFTNESAELYQLHVESGQLKDRLNQGNGDFFENVISESEALGNFFYEEFIDMAKKNKTGVNQNKYLDYLISFGFCESLFEMLDINTPSITFNGRELPKLPDLSKFKNVDQLIIIEAKLAEIHPSVGLMKELRVLSLPKNRLKTIPSEIGNLKHLQIINLKGNPIGSIPDEIKFLDKTNGGSLIKFAIDKDKLGEQGYKRLKLLLPTTDIS